MNFKIKNFGKIAEANIKLDGITVICGDNNTGKSTVGKALFSFYNSLYDYKYRIVQEKVNEIRSSILRSEIPSTFRRVMGNNSVLEDFILSHDGNDRIEEEDVKTFIENQFSIKVSKDKLGRLVEYLNTPDSDLINESVSRYVSNVMNGQVKNAFSKIQSRCTITAEFKNGKKNVINLNKQTCTCKIEEPIEHLAYYINTPFSLDSLNDRRLYFLDRNSNPMSLNIVDAILNARAKINEDSMTNIFDTVLNKKALDDVRGIIKKAYSGDTITDHGKYFYVENGISFDFRNISAGLKSFAIIERLLETGVLKKKDVLILDEPEIHLHSEWQIIYAELIVILQKTFDLTILLVTHSSQFLESLIYYMEKYEISKKGSYYIPVQEKEGVRIIDDSDNLKKMKKSLKSGMYTLANKKLEDLTNGDYDEEDNQ